jgi:hypothetical protein
MRRIILIALTTTLGLGVGLHNAAAQQNDAQSKAEFYVGAGECGSTLPLPIATKPLQAPLHGRRKVLRRAYRPKPSSSLTASLLKTQVMFSTQYFQGRNLRLASTTALSCRLI